MDVVDKKFQCTDCGKSYKRKSDLHRHYRTKKEKITLILPKKTPIIRMKMKFHKQSMDLLRQSK